MYGFSKAVAIGIAATALPSAAALAQSPAGERTAAALMSVEHDWLTALNRHDVATLTRILGQEYIDSDSQGDAITRAQYLAFFSRPVSGPAPHLQQTFEDTKVRFVAGGNVAIVTGLVITRPASASAPATSSNPDAVRHSRFSDVFVWRDARWQAVTGQETHFTPAKKSR
jgi:ketosteroid isomerase-like protein